MTDIDLAALKAEARSGNMTDPFSVLALIERLERAERTLRIAGIQKPTTLVQGDLFWLETDGRQVSPTMRVVEQARLEKLEAVAKAAREWLGPMRHSHGFSEFRARCGECRLRDDLAALEAP